MRRILSLIWVVTMVVSLGLLCTVSAVAKNDDSEPNVRVNGRMVEFPDKKPYIKNGRTYIPVRFVAEALGAEVFWDKELQGAVIKKDGVELQLPIGSQTMTIIDSDEIRTVEMDAAAVKENGRTLVPIRFVAEALGAWVSYSPAYKTVQIYNDVLTPEEINELHSLKNHRNVCDERKELVSGKYGYENLNECAISDFVSHIEYTITNFFNGDTYVNGIDPQEDKIQLLADYIRHEMGAYYSNSFYGSDATFRTDVSCVAATTTSTNSTYVNRGYLTITFDDDADIRLFKSLHTYCDFGTIYAGGTYTYAIESIWMLNIATGRPQCMGQFNMTNGVYEQWA